MFIVFCVCLFISRFSADAIKHLPQEEGGRRGIFMYRKKAAYIYEPPFVIEESRSVCQYFEAAFGHEERMLPLSRR